MTVAGWSSNTFIILAQYKSSKEGQKFRTMSETMSHQNPSQQLITTNWEIWYFKSLVIRKKSMYYSNNKNPEISK